LLANKSLINNALFLEEMNPDGYKFQPSSKERNHLKPKEVQLKKRTIQSETKSTYTKHL